MKKILKYDLNYNEFLFWKIKLGVMSESSPNQDIYPSLSKPE